jgi:hypothetical protein
MDSAPHSRFAWLQTWPGILTVGFFALILLTALAYVEENWRGERVWAQTKAELEARGENFDRAKFIPPPEPDEQNFGALDYFKTTSDGRLRITKAIDPIGNKTPYSMDNAKENEGKGWLPYLGRWTKGEVTDTAAVEKQLEDVLHRQDPAAKIVSDATPIDVFTKICPVLADLRQANARLPLCRFDLDYNNPKPWMISLGPTTDQIKVAKIVSYDSQLALLSHHPEIALEDSEVDWKICSGLNREPLLVCGLVAMGMVAIQLNVIEQGLYEHDWTDAQLTQLDDDLGKMNILADGQLSLRGDIALFEIPATDATLTNRSLFLSSLSPAGRTFDYKDIDSWEGLGIRLFYQSVPNGWLQLNRADSVRRILDGTRSIDPAARRVHPEQVEAAVPVPENESLSFLTLTVGPMLNGVRKFAYFQVQIDMTRIACRLERYRLAHGSFPATLDTLIPAYGAALPHDVMTGQPYIYRLDKDGTYTLYSAGWNQKDDHGDISTPGATYAPTPMDTSLDWVWTNHVIKKK